MLTIEQYARASYCIDFERIRGSLSSDDWNALYKFLYCSDLIGPEFYRTYQQVALERAHAKWK